MKKIVCFLLSAFLLTAFASEKAFAQMGKITKEKTISAADTTEIVAKDGVKILSYTYLESSGTTAGKIYVEGTVDGRKWWHVDSSLSLSDVATAQSVKVDISALYYSKYRARNTNTSAATGVIYFNLVTAATLNRDAKEMKLADQ